MRHFLLAVLTALGVAFSALAVASPGLASVHTENAVTYGGNG